MGFDDSYNELLKVGAKTNIGFQQNNKEKIKTLDLKIKVAFNYQNLLYNCLRKVLANLHLKILNENEKKFTENFVALAYFRIPEFRAKLLDCLKLSMASG